MAHGLRLIHNNKTPSLDGREYGIYCSAEFRHGRDSWDVARGGAPSEVLRDRAARKAAGPVGQTEHGGRVPRVSRTALTGFGELRRSTGTAAAPQRAVLRRWERADSAPCLNDVLCPRSAQREAVQAKIMSSAAALPPAVAGGGAAASSQELFAPPSLCPEFPVPKWHYHGERLPGNAKPAAGSITQELPERFFPTAEKPPPVDKYRYYSNPSLMLSENYHADDPDCPAPARMTWRARKGESLGGL
mmetsp:Transcript_5195/g.16727  ORF Transcript_5195/g.16727 Transcript_5195/m.16727 type:complete len:246 (+) Transcript_5195:73-810(+)|eukprot:CAMPEP_0204518028 /NCGR_PEP_ID=MMETSP0661-20131031/3985_1 /ASSEMBLY_ACC=CAM_ASM_000606 /TAXON_ID=109239 /ORGANISM="Alexandrium margalefi, Strain AMGDE01CS-322" /LENGTH=245 /DNA_ID=CAMNT_0051523459 /DNA_START=66 /DNA_END=803 /DNA_ORIENTATION=+